MSESTNDCIEIIEGLAAENLFAAACKVCAGKGWFFGNRSNDLHDMPFWKMDLDGDPVFDAIWQAARPMCEAFAGRKLRVVRQYANGHTYGLGGQLHRDDEREGTYTLLYYPMTEWLPEWQGETVFLDETTGEIDLSVRPKPNRAVFFDARIPHAGRAPSRSCPALRVTVAFKLESAEGDEISPEKTEVAASPASPVNVTEVERDGTHRVYRIHVDAAHVSKGVTERLLVLAQTLRLPGFRPGNIPMDFLESRYGKRSRAEVTGQLGLQVSERLLAAGGLPASMQLIHGEDAGDVEFRLTVTHLPDLPETTAEQWKLQRLTATDAALAEAKLSVADATQLLSQHLHVQVLDHLDDAYQFPVAAPLVEREFETLRQTVTEQTADDESRADLLAELRKISERRVRLGAVVIELARRHRLVTPGAAGSLQDTVIAWLIAQAHVTERSATAAELSEIAG